MISADFDAILFSFAPTCSCLSISLRYLVTSLFSVSPRHRVLPSHSPAPFSSGRHFYRTLTFQNHRVVLDPAPPPSKIGRIINILFVEHGHSCDFLTPHCQSRRPPYPPQAPHVSISHNILGRTRLKLHNPLIHESSTIRRCHCPLPSNQNEGQILIFIAIHRRKKGGDERVGRSGTCERWKWGMTADKIGRSATESISTASFFQTPTHEGWYRHYEFPTSFQRWP